MPTKLSLDLGGVKVEQATPLRVNYDARQTSRLGDHYRGIVRIVLHHRCSLTRVWNWISRCENTSLCGVRERERERKGRVEVSPRLSKRERETERVGRGKRKWWIHVVGHLSDNLTNVRLSPPSVPRLQYNSAG